MKRWCSGMAIGLLTMSLSGCGGGGERGGGHEHAAPHGGKLVEVGEHAYQIELLHDAGAGTLTLYVLDAHAENPVRIAQPKIEAEIRAGSGEPVPLALDAQAVPASGETPGDTSVFSGSGDALKQPGVLLVNLRKVTIGGRDFENLPGSVGKR